MAYAISEKELHAINYSNYVRIQTLIQTHQHQGLLPVMVAVNGLTLIMSDNVL